MFTILYVDDDTTLLTRGKLVLEHLQECIVTTSRSAHEVLNSELHPMPDVIISDADLPGVDSSTFLKEIRSRYATVPIIIFSRNLTEDLLIEAMNRGFTYCIKKGPTPELQFPDLLQMIRIVMQHRDSRCKTFASPLPVTQRPNTGSTGQPFDITESKEHFELIFRFNPTIMALLTLPDRTFFDVNDAFLTSLGYTREEVIGKTSADLELFVNPEQARIIDEQVKSKQKLTHFENQVRGKNGNIFETLFFTDIMSIQGQEFIMDLMIDISRQKELEKELEFHEHELIRYSDELSNDIAERKRMETLLREKNEELDRYFTSALDLLCIANTKGEFVRLNPEWEQVLGYSVQELEGRLFLDFVHPEDLEKTIAAIETLSEQADIISFENRYLSKDGSYRWIEWRSRPSGEMIYAAARDITDRKLAEEALRKANRQINLLTSITRHDINNQLSVIYAYLALAEPYITDPKLAEYFKEIESETQIIQSQIAFTSTYQELGSQQPRWQNVDTTLSRLEFPETITFHSRVQGIEVYADPILEKVFSNLLDNSIRHGEQVTDIRVSHLQADEQLTILWEDNGVGIPTEEKEKIFERGYGKNTGLGMFLVREILSLTEIGISETGEPGKGARFEIKVPKGKWRR